MLRTGTDYFVHVGSSKGGVSAGIIAYGPDLGYTKNIRKPRSDEYLGNHGKKMAK